MIPTESGEIQSVAIIPAFNEEGTVGGVVRAALRAKRVGAVVMVNDGSADETSKVAYQAAELEITSLTKPFIVADHTTNQGKAEAMQTGFAYAEWLGDGALKTVVFLDADPSPISSRATYNRKLGTRIANGASGGIIDRPDEFINLFAGYLDELIRPVSEDEKIMTIGLLQRNWMVDALRLRLNWGALAGNRAVNAELWRSMLSDYQQRGLEITGWQTEAALNTYTRKNRDNNGTKLNRHIGKLLMPGIVNVGSRVKAGGFISGLARMASINGQALGGFAKYGLRS